MESAARFNAGVVALAATFILAFSSIATSAGPQDYVLFNAIRRGDLALLESHLRERAPVNVRAADGTTPLMMAVLQGTPTTVRLLLDYGADPNAVNKNGGTGLLYAAGNLQMVQQLVEHGADINARSALGNTPLIAAAAHPDNLSVVKLLLNRGADLHAQNGNGVTALTSAVVASDADTVKFLLDQGCKPGEVKNLFGAADNSLLQLAAQYGNQEIVEMLLAQGADVNAADPNFAGHALNYALLSEKPDVARRLIEAGADLKACSPVGKVPPIVFAAYSETGDMSVAKCMIEHGADTATMNQAGETALTWARRRGFPDLVSLLACANTPNPVDLAVQVPHRDLGADPSERPSLVRAAIERSISLLQNSSDVFLENRRACVSCHHQNLPSVALGWARDRGFTISEESMNRIIERQLNSWSRRVQAAYEMDRPFPVPPQVLGYGLWGLAALNHSGDVVTDATVWYLASIQKPDGHWSRDGVARPPMGTGDVLSTALAIRALQLYPLEGRRDEMAARVERAKQWLAEIKPTQHQDIVFKLLALAWAGQPVEALRDDLTVLTTTQRPDGGWSQLPKLGSDVWATGQALVALRIAGRVQSTDPVYQRGIDYLLRTQFDDGSWYVQSRAWPFQPSFDSGFPFGRDQWISAGATAWVTMALLLSVEPTEPPIVKNNVDYWPRSDLGLAAAPGTAEPVDRSPPVAAQRRTEPLDFARDIKPILERSCATCHSGDKPEGGFKMTRREDLLRGGESGDSAVLPGRSGQSPLFTRISGLNPDLSMPPLKNRDKFPALSADELQTFRAWIDEGVPWPAGVAIKPAAY
jgi:ankyrin repeat protein